MKIRILSLLIISIGIFSCKKEDVQPIQQNRLNVDYSNDEIIIMPQINKIRDVLVFESHEEIGIFINAFAKMSAEQKIEWGLENNFKSQQILLEELTKKQLEFGEKNYPGINPDLSIEELMDLGVHPRLCPEIENYVQKGMIVKTVEEDGSISFDLALEDKGMVHVTNLDGLVIIGDKLYQFKNNLVKYMPFSDVNDFERLKNTNQTSESQGIYVQSGGDRSPQFTVGNIFDQNCNCWIWYYNSSNERFCHYVVIQSNWDSYQNKVYSSYYNFEKAQKKILGVWIKTSGYKPLYYVEGTWSWDLTISGPTYPSGSGFSSGLSSPLYQYYGNSNEELEYLYPYGYSNVGVGWSGDEVEIHNMHIHGTFWGGCCGYHTNYYYN